MLRVSLLIGIMILVLSGCDKYRARKWSGTYLCNVHYHYWDMLPTLVDSNYSESIEINHSKDKIIIFGHEIPVDSVKDERLYCEGYVHDYFQIQFKGDSIYYLSSGGGLGGNASFEYRGIKL